MLMNAFSTLMTVTPMQSAPIQEGHLLASAIGMRITMGTERRALVIVCYTQFFRSFIVSIIVVTSLKTADNKFTTKS